MELILNLFILIHIISYSAIMYPSITLLILSFVICKTTATAIEVEYLSGSPRLNHSSYMDFYFRCIIENASTLQWKVNGFGLGGYFQVRTGHILSGSRSRFDYTASLLSLQPTSIEALFTFVSVLIVSTLASHLNLDVVCSNGLASSNTSNTEPTTLHEIANYSNTVSLRYILSRDLIPNNESLFTSIFECGVNNSYLNWQANSNKYGFSIFDGVNQDRLFLEQGSTTFDQQAILIAKQPYPIVTVLFVRSTSDIIVKCGFPENELQLSSCFLCSNLPASTNTQSLFDGITDKLESKSCTSGKAG